MKITIVVGITGIGGGIDERHTFSNAKDASAFLLERAPRLTPAQLDEIMSAPDTQFDVQDLIVSPDGEGAYWGPRRYEVAVEEE